MTPPITLELLRALPKVELHRHLEGALRPETLWDLHRENKQTAHASLAALRTAYTIPPGDAPGFDGFLSRFSALGFKFGGTDSLRRLAAEAVQDAAEDGVAHLELRFSPVGFARRMADFHPGAPLPKTVDDIRAAALAVVDGATREARARGIGVSFIATLGRHFGRAVNRPAAEMLDDEIGAHFCALDLAGDEAFPAAEFIADLKRWKAAGRGITIHAGEDPGGGGPAAVREALAELGADRIGHGVRAAEDHALVGELAARQTTLEICPTSNFQTGACASLARHPLGALLRAGVRATINTDDPALSQTTLSREYLRAVEECGLSWSELHQCALNAARSACLPEPEKSALAAKVSAAWAAAG
jgi:adenosine deaminase